MFSSPSAVKMLSLSGARIMDRDQDLVERCRANDRVAFDELVERHKNRIYGFIVRMVNDTYEAEDLTQEVFLRAYKCVRGFRGEANFQTWLYRIASNLCVDWSRKRKRRVDVAFSLNQAQEEEADGTKEIPDHGANPEVAAQRAELQASVREVLAQLSDKLRAVIVLYDLEGLTYEEIARSLGCPIGTVKSRLFNARAELGRRLRSYVEGA